MKSLHYDKYGQTSTQEVMIDDYCKLFDLSQQLKREWQERDDDWKHVSESKYKSAVIEGKWFNKMLF